MPDMITHSSHPADFLAKLENFLVTIPGSYERNIHIKVAGCSVSFLFFRNGERSRSLTLHVNSKIIVFIKRA
jgi:hypothetical protein